MKLIGKTNARDVPRNPRVPKTFGNIMSDLSRFFEQKGGEIKWHTGKEKSDNYREVNLVDMMDSCDSWVLLVNVLNVEVANPVTQKRSGSVHDRKTYKLEDDRGMESSSHIVIFKEKREHGFLVLYEKNQYLCFSRMKGFLNYLLRELSKEASGYSLAHPNGARNATMRVYPFMEFLGHISDDFQVQLSNGSLSEIRLVVDSDKVRGYDISSHGDLIEAEIKMSVDKKSIQASGGNYKHIEKALSYAGSLSGRRVRVKYKDDEGGGHTRELDVESGRLVDDDKFVRREVVSGFSEKLSTSYPKINSEIVSKILEVGKDA